MQMMQLKVLFKVKRRGNNNNNSQNNNSPGKAGKQWKSWLVCSSGRFFPLHQTNQNGDWVLNVQSMQRIILPYFPNSQYLSLFLSLSLSCSLSFSYSSFSPLSLLLIYLLFPRSLSFSSWQRAAKDSH